MSKTPAADAREAGTSFILANSSFKRFQAVASPVVGLPPMLLVFDAGLAALGPGNRKDEGGRMNKNKASKGRKSDSSFSQHPSRACHLRPLWVASAIAA
jgi:hypothetical protein